MKIKNIEQVESILNENKMYVKDEWVFHKFWRNVDIKYNTEECWNWTAGLMAKGYGVFWDYNSVVRSHRMAYVLTKGSIPDGLQVQHLCNNRKCCNPTHLELGDNSKNQQHAIKCGRRKNIQNHVKLVEEQIREIHTIYLEEPEITKQELAEMFEISISQIYKIINGNQWVNIYKEFYKK